MAVLEGEDLSAAGDVALADLLSGESAYFIVHHGPFYFEFGCCSWRGGAGRPAER